MKNVILATVLMMSSISVFASPPKLEFFLTKYDGNNCTSRAVAALSAAGFEIKKGTYQGEDRVGVFGNYKGAVGCSSEVKNSVVFVVSGPDYKKAHTLARSIQKNF